MIPRPEPYISGNYLSTITRNVRLSRRYFLLGLKRPGKFPPASPGNFLHVKIPSTQRFFLRRPFSIMDCTEDEILLLILEKGEGTRVLRSLEPGEELEFLGPLGNSFPSPAGLTLAVAGGVGLAPLYFLAKRFACDEVRLLYGARTAEDLFLGGLDLSRIAEALATEDGSHGFAGTVVDLARAALEEGGVEAVFSCGPGPMLVAIAEAAGGAGIAHYVSLENRMACGLGVCRSCVVRVEDEEGNEVNRTVCRDGPVFDAARVVWRKLPSL